MIFSGLGVRKHFVAWRARGDTEASMVDLRSQ
jgi:hypothetical protein